MKKVLISIITAFIFISQAVSLKAIELVGAGATFPYPLYSKMFDTYYQLTKVKVNYQSIGSGGGIKQLLSKTVNFGASDAVMEDEEKSKAPVKIHHIPTCLGAVVITYNLPGNPKLKFTPDIIADIFLGKIKSWDDKRIKKINPKVKIPKFPVVVIRRSDGSGTTYIFSDYLSKVSSDWEKKVGRGKSLNWPVGLGGKGNEGVAGLIKQTPGAIGYTELIYAVGNKMPVASVKNSSGNYIMPSIKSVSESANINLPDDTEVSITNTSAYNGYPISSFTWLLVYDELSTVKLKQDEAKALIDLLWWMVHDGQKLAKPLHYGPLSPAAVKKAEVILKSIKFNGKNVK